jgi:hypothetical protein
MREPQGEQPLGSHRRQVKVDRAFEEASSLTLIGFHGPASTTAIGRISRYPISEKETAQCPTKSLEDK